MTKIYLVRSKKNTIFAFESIKNNLIYFIIA